MSTIEDIEALDFVRRQQSWVATSDSLFHKVFRKSDDLAKDFRDPECIAVAHEEFHQTEILHALDARVHRSKSMQKACLSYPLLSGPDMHVYLKQCNDIGVSKECLRQAISLLGNLHRRWDPNQELRLKDYERETFVPPSAGLLSRMNDRRRTIIIDGFEVRNFRFDNSQREWIFFDPHRLHSGYPEEDVARFVVSLLMIGWERSHRCRIWTGFDLDDLILRYEAAASLRLDIVLIRYFFAEVIAMRDHHAKESLRKVRLLQASAGHLYRQLFFAQMRSWVRAHGFRL